MRPLASLLCCVVAGSALAQSARLIEVDCKVGSVFKYDLNLEASSPTLTGRAGCAVVITQKLVRRTGDEFEWQYGYRVPSQYATGEAKKRKVDFKKYDKTSQNLVATARNHTLKINAPDSLRPPMVSFSVKPVKPGDTWIGVYPLKGYRSECKLVKYVGQGKKTLAVIEVWYKFGDLMKQTTPAVFWVDVENGIVTKAIADILLTPKTDPVRMKYSLVLRP